MTTEQELATLRAELEKVMKERDDYHKKAIELAERRDIVADMHREDAAITDALFDKIAAERDAALAKLEEAHSIGDDYRNIAYAAVPMADGMQGGRERVRILWRERDDLRAQLAAARADSAASLKLWREIITKARDAWIKHATDNSPLSVFAAVLTGIDAAIDSAKEGK